MIFKILLGIFIVLEVIGIGAFIYAIKNAPVYPPDYDL